LTPEEQAVYENPRKYAQDYYYKDLVAKSEVESGTGGINIGINMGGGPDSRTMLGGAEAGEIPAGKKNESTGLAETSIPYGAAGYSFAMPGNLGKIVATNLKRFGKVNKLDKLGTIRGEEITTPSDFTYQDAVPIPTAAYDYKVKLKNGEELQFNKNTVPTKRTFQILSENNIAIPGDLLTWQGWATGTKETGTGERRTSELTIVPWNDFYPTYSSYMLSKGIEPKNLNDYLPTEDIYIKYGIRKKGGSESRSEEFDAADF
jgi:hypothetical protein